MVFGANAITILSLTLLNRIIRYIMNWKEIYFFIIVLVGIVSLGVLMSTMPSETVIQVLREFGGF